MEQPHEEEERESENAAGSEKNVLRNIFGDGKRKRATVQGEREGKAGARQEVRA